ncbi:conserved protein of unknown function [Methylacidimicrobium sp. AP8]|uniref:DUF1802 family protein n=1 Tax=Methylacidimicrobium sp. AP8 TaxID=2730359 RepID=UPI0018C12DBB|nr:DUF1802 family protein [Methylacidimicrobium sp. AP8]CAB4244625.1 conserved protein of unknown function [Methylacidimicrobium sp. AP8]
MAADDIPPARKSGWPALKEAAPVVQALGQGWQIFVLRKGGIAEGRRGFAADYPDFWLFPTRFHAQREKIRPEFRFLAAPDERGEREEVVELQFVAKLLWSRFLVDWETVRRLAGFQLWEEGLLRERFAFGKKEGLHLLMLRIFRSSKVACPWDRRFGGCRSWITVRHPWSERLDPVVPDEAFALREKEVLRAAALDAGCPEPGREAG